MEITNETMNILIFLIPGFLSSVILNGLIIRKEKDNFSKIIEALIFSMLIYAIVSVFIGYSPIVMTQTITGNVTKYYIEYHAHVLIPIVLLSLVFPLLIGILNRNDLHMKILRKLRITDKTSRSAVWVDVFTDQKRYVIVNLKDGRRIFGWPMYYSNTPEEGALYLYDPAWVVKSRYIDLGVHGLFLVESKSIETIEFTNVTEKNAKNINE